MTMGPTRGRAATMAVAGVLVLLGGVGCTWRRTTPPTTAPTTTMPMDHGHGGDGGHGGDEHSTGGAHSIPARLM